MQSIDGPRLAEAVAFAAEKHAQQRRKGNGAPYLCHLLGVAATVVDHGGDTDQAIAALLHDTLEDCPDVTGEDLAAAFGARVARIVGDCTDTLPGDTPEHKAPWLERKKRYLDHLRQVGNESLLVAACDKRDNLDSMVGELRTRGAGVLEKFKGTPEQQVWYYEEVLRRIVGRVPLRLQLDLESLIAQLRTLIQAGQTATFSREELDVGD